MSCGGWAFRWSKFNSNCAERNKVILSSAECSSDHWKGLLEEYPDLEKVRLPCTNTSPLTDSSSMHVHEE